MLYLDRNNIGVQGAQYFGNILQNNTVIQIFCLYNSCLCISFNTDTHYTQPCGKQDWYSRNSIYTGSITK